MSAAVGLFWRDLFGAICRTAGLAVELLEHAAPAPLEDLWNRPDMAAVFMCGLPFSLTQPRPFLVAAPVPSPGAFDGAARYWSEFVVRRDSAASSVADTFGSRIAFTVPDSQSGCVAALSYLQALDPSGSCQKPRFAEIIAPTITPLGALDAVVNGLAEIAPIDSYAFCLLGAHRPDLTTRVRVVGRTVPTPIPPLVASPGVAADGALDALSSAFVAAHSDTALRPLMDRLLVHRFIRPDPASYAILRQRRAAAIEFWRTHSLATVTHPAFVW